MSQATEWFSLLSFACLPAVLEILFRLAGDPTACRYCLRAALGSPGVIVCSQASSEIVVLSPVPNYPTTVSAVIGFAGGILCAHFTRKRQKARRSTR